MTWLNLFVYQFSNLILGFIVCVCLTPRSDKMTRPVCTLLYFVMISWPSFAKFFIQEQGELFDVIYNVSIILYFVFAFIFFKDRIWKKVLVVVILISFIILAEELTYAVLHITMDDFLAESMTSFGLFVRTVNCGMLLFLFVPFILIWLRLNNQKLVFSFSIWKTLMIPLGFWFFIDLISEIYFEAGKVVNSMGTYLMIAIYLLEMVFVMLFAIENDKTQKEIEIYEMKNELSES